ncbi:MAG: YfhO family protein [Chitinispirillia bacterium]|nr:YfhO family protein [Chitinispirillia bacterium]
MSKKPVNPDRKDAVPVAAKSAAAPPSAALAPRAFRHGDLICLGGLLVIVAIIFSSFLFSGDMLASGISDQITAVGQKQFYGNSIMRYGQFPTWESGRLGGMPSIDAVFGDAFYPVTGLLRPFVPAYRLFGYTMVLHVFLAGLFFFLMMRRSFGSARLTAFAGSLFFMLNPMFVSHVSPGHDGKMFVIAWLPFVVWRLRSLLNIPGFRNAAILAVGIAMMVLSSHMQLTYFVCMGIFLYWVADIAKSIAAKEEKKRIVFKAGFFWVGVFLGLGIACVQMYPSYMFIREAFSVRGVDRGFEFAASWSINWAEFVSLWVHEFGNSLDYYWGKNGLKLNTEYAGAIPLLLTFLAVASKPKSFWRLFWAGVAVLATLYALGANTPFFTVAYHLIPGVRRFRAPSMIMFWFSFATALMAAFFIKDLLTKRFENFGRQQQKWTKGLWIALGGVTLLSVLFSVESAVASLAAPMMGNVNGLTGESSSKIFTVNFRQKFLPNLWLWWFFATVTLGMLIAVVNGKIKGSTLVYALIVMGVVDMTRVDSQFIKVESPWRWYHRSNATLNELKTEFEKAPFRVFSMEGTFTKENQEALYGLEGVGGFHDNELNCYRAFRGDRGDRNYVMDIVEVTPDGRLAYKDMARMISEYTPFLDLADVEYILTASRVGGIAKIKNLTAMGRLSYAADYAVMNEENVINALRTGMYNYRTTVALLEEPELPFTKGNVDERQLTVEWKKYTPNKRVAAVTMPADGFLRISEVYYPGWQIKVDGSPVKYYRADMAWMAVPLKAGSYEVVMMPKSLYLDDAITVSAIFIAITVLILVLSFIQRRRKTA